MPGWCSSRTSSPASRSGPIARATTAQKCVRAGGKHNDLDNVGYTARHHTFFEMLGNFSFGDYFKPLAIELAWTLDHQAFRPEQGPPARHRLPRRTTRRRPLEEDRRLPDSRRSSASPPRTIFGQMGDTGPAAPVRKSSTTRATAAGRPARQPRRGRRPLPRVLEPRVHAVRAGAPGERLPLPRPSIDTGMGLERIAAILQGMTVELRHRPDAHPHRRGRGAVTGVDPDGPQAASHRIIADHLRASSFLVADGVDPSNEGRGYVLRRIMRRAMRHAQLLGARDPLMWRLVPALVGEMGQAYPELRRGRRSRSPRSCARGKRGSGSTLARGLSILEDEARGLDGRVAHVDGRGRVQALRHVRLPARSHPGGVAGPRHRRRRGRVQRRHGAPAGRSAQGLGRLRRSRDRNGLVRRSRTARARPSSSATHRERRGRRSRRIVTRRRRSAQPRAGEIRLSRAEPDAILRRVGRPDRRHRPDARRRA